MPALLLLSPPGLSNKSAGNRKVFAELFSKSDPPEAVFLELNRYFFFKDDCHDRYPVFRRVWLSHRRMLLFYNCYQLGKEVWKRCVER